MEGQYRGEEGVRWVGIGRERIVVWRYAACYIQREQYWLRVNLSTGGVVKFCFRTLIY